MCMCVCVCVYVYVCVCKVERHKTRIKGAWPQPLPHLDDHQSNRLPCNVYPFLSIYINNYKEIPITSDSLD